RLDAGADVVLLEPTPAGLADRLAEQDAEAGRAAVIGIEHAEAGIDRALDEGLERRLAMRRGPAMHLHDEAARRAFRAIEPALDVEPVDRAPAHILRRQIIGREIAAGPGIGDVAQEPCAPAVEREA